MVQHGRQSIPSPPTSYSFQKVLEEGVYQRNTLGNDLIERMEKLKTR